MKMITAAVCIPKRTHMTASFLLLIRQVFCCELLIPKLEEYIDTWPWPWPAVLAKKKKIYMYILVYITYKICNIFWFKFCIVCQKVFIAISVATFPYNRFCQFKFLFFKIYICIYPFLPTSIGRLLYPRSNSQIAKNRLIFSEGLRNERPNLRF